MNNTRSIIIQRIANSFVYSFLIILISTRYSYQASGKCNKHSNKRLNMFPNKRPCSSLDPLLHLPRLPMSRLLPLHDPRVRLQQSRYASVILISPTLLQHHRISRLQTRHCLRQRQSHRLGLASHTAAHHIRHHIESSKRQRHRQRRQHLIAIVPRGEILLNSPPRLPPQVMISR